MLPAAGDNLHRATGVRHGRGSEQGARGLFILDSDLHLMEPYDLWERYLEGPHKANPPHFFAAHRRPEEEVKAVGMEVQGLAIPRTATRLARLPQAASCGGAAVPGIRTLRLHRRRVSMPPRP